MQFIHWILDILRDPSELIAWGGYPALMAIIFAETGAMVFFLPGDSLLFVAGLFASRGTLNLAMLNLLLIPMAILGDATSYVIGRRAGPMIFSRPETRFFKPQHIRTAHAFYEKHGGKAIILARFVPIVRTFVPVAAGVAQMRYRDFAIFNIAGAALWIASMTVAGYVLGQNEWVSKNLEKMVIGIVLVSVLPAVFGYLKERRAGASPATPAPASTDEPSA